MHKKMSTLCSLLSPFFIWAWVIWFFEPPSYLLPSPIAVLRTFRSEYVTLLSHAYSTFSASLLGLCMSICVGLAVGLILHLSRIARFWCLPWILLSQALPTLVIAPLIVLWFGFGMQAKVIVTAMVIFFPITLSFYEGLNQTPKVWLDMSRAIGAPPHRILWYLRIPYAVRNMAPAFRMASVWAPMGTVIGEWVGSSEGLGFLMLHANARLDAAMLFSALLLLMLGSLLLYWFSLKMWQWYA